MSMKCAKPKSSGREKDGGTDFWAKPGAPEKTWDEATEGKLDGDFTQYAMTARFTKGQLVVHPKFGRGLVTDVDAGRVEILFQEGRRSSVTARPSAPGAGCVVAQDDGRGMRGDDPRRPRNALSVHAILGTLHASTSRPSA